MDSNKWLKSHSVTQNQLEFQDIAVYKRNGWCIIDNKKAKKWGSLI